MMSRLIYPADSSPLGTVHRTACKVRSGEAAEIASTEAEDSGIAPLHLVCDETPQSNVRIREPGRRFGVSSILLLSR